MNAAILLAVALTTQANSPMPAELRRVCEENIYHDKVLSCMHQMEHSSLLWGPVRDEHLQIEFDYLRQILRTQYNAKIATSPARVADLDDEYLAALKRAVDAIPAKAIYAKGSTSAQLAAALKAADGATGAEWRAFQAAEHLKQDKEAADAQADDDPVPVQPKQQRQPRKSVMKVEKLTPAQLKERAQQERKDQLAKRRQRYQRSLNR